MNNASIKEWIYDVQHYTVDHIKHGEIWSDDLMPLGGFHVKPRPLECKVDAIEINNLFCNKDVGALVGILNINIFHTDLPRINELTQIVELIMEDAYVEGFVFQKDFSRMFKNGKYLWYNNLRYHYSMNRKEFRVRYGN
ncbi:hypothetical protein [Pedobacter nototheniae]|uniref:hypothetical protein n=1 Tax=Pedobacter nototheniae TaxID=2488994 RepID=UPI001039A2C3|nr:hypothetical protein [Pedobacter nototheniae]